MRVEDLKLGDTLRHRMNQSVYTVTLINKTPGQTKYIKARTTQGEYTVKENRLDDFDKVDQTTGALSAAPRSCTCRVPGPGNGNSKCKAPMRAVCQCECHQSTGVPQQRDTVAKIFRITPGHLAVLKILAARSNTPDQIEAANAKGFAKPYWLSMHGMIAGIANEVRDVTPSQGTAIRKTNSEIDQEVERGRRMDATPAQFEIAKAYDNANASASVVKVSSPAAPKAPEVKARPVRKSRYTFI